MEVVETCPRCHGYGIEVISETNNQYDRTIQQEDTCSECGGDGIIIIEQDD